MRSASQGINALPRDTSWAPVKHPGGQRPTWPIREGYHHGCPPTENLFAVQGRVSKRGRESRPETQLGTCIKRAGQKPSIGELGVSLAHPPTPQDRTPRALPPLPSRHRVTMTEELLLSSANGNKRSFLIMETGSGARANRTGSICNCQFMPTRTSCRLQAKDVDSQRLGTVGARSSATKPPADR